MYEAGVRLTSPEINEEMRHPMLETLQTKPKDLDGSRFWPSSFRDKPAARHERRAYRRIS
ncbi:hypothetical protein ARMGADRAFT_1078418 [Armillaria gallica]|uniref:Uncharacterized protein n=1 Tax=Armillaria gallica TaxID=47427 RepID=A0A2H3DUS6_ARMGA|nr:hypothetical protein ARMGADRAFT_1078418 [Armillaria gallica]